LYDMSQTTALEHLVDIQKKIRNETFGFGDAWRGTITFSAGLAEFPSDGDDLLELYVAADTALSEAKDAGRDCIIGTRVGRS
jgi:GGDEF domain-containing protein